ncbi:MAG: MarR family winged helix-turn-helix transcriptional regulator [Actinomycetes bacterium]
MTSTTDAADRAAPTHGRAPAYAGEILVADGAIAEAPAEGPAGGPAEGPLDVTATARLSHEVVRLVRASHAMRAQIHARQDDGVEWAGYLLLFQLCKEGPQRSSTLAAAACVDPSTVSRQVAELVSLGLVERRADPGDGRATLLAATELGEQRHRAVYERRDRAFAHLLADWPEGEIELLGALLHRLNDSLLDHRSTLLDAITDDATASTATRPERDHT